MVMASKGRYQPLPTVVNSEQVVPESPPANIPSGRATRLLMASLVISMFLNAFLAMKVAVHSPVICEKTFIPTGDAITGFSNVPRVRRKNSYFAQPYVEKNRAVSDAAWDAIELGHGAIRFNKDYALERGLAPSRAWKPNRTEAVYAFSAYHALHCTVLVRKFLRDHIRDGKKPGEHTWSHAWHCMEMLREEIMCTADGTIQAMPLDPNDRSKALLAGHGEIRQCADWSYLRDFSTKHSAGWISAEANGGLAQFGSHYPDGDGIIIPEAEA